MTKSKTSSAKKKAVIKPSLFAVGDYITAPDCVYLKIVSVVDSGMGPMYGVLTPKDNSVHWRSQYQLDNDDMRLGIPEYDKFKTIQAGDILKIGDKEETHYITVLARVADAVLLSSRPNKRMAEMLVKLDQAFSEMSEQSGLSIMDMMGEREMRDIKRLGSSLHAAKIADEWMAIESLTLMNWELVSE